MLIKIVKYYLLNIVFKLMLMKILFKISLLVLNERMITTDTIIYDITIFYLICIVILK